MGIFVCVFIFTNEEAPVQFKGANTKRRGEHLNLQKDQKSKQCSQTLSEGAWVFLEEELAEF